MVARCELANLRHAAANAALAGENGEGAAERIAGAERAVDKLVLRLMDGAMKQERLDRALQLISRCAAVRFELI